MYSAPPSSASSPEKKTSHYAQVTANPKLLASVATFRAQWEAVAAALKKSSGMFFIRASDQGPVTAHGPKEMDERLGQGISSRYKYTTKSQTERSTLQPTTKRKMK
ncbi:hypothetical protein CC2G_009891 [Coprinopsis cinerea AmutBmut pab1-1]|nr:hypothetical protein CC2G_009891 [Coprinopsis cinerea AmutBmut pab1-1]